MAEYINVPVPPELVPAVYKFLAAAQSPSPEAVPSATEATGESRDWSREQLDLLAAAEASSVRSFCQVLDLLSEIAPRPMPIQAIGEKLGEPGLTLQNRYGAVTRWMRNRMGGDVRWPIHFTPGGEWYMTEHNADLWKQASSNH